MRPRPSLAPSGPAYRVAIQPSQTEETCHGYGRDPATCGSGCGRPRIDRSRRRCVRRNDGLVGAERRRIDRGVGRSLGRPAGSPAGSAAGATIASIKIAGPGPVMTLDVAKATELSSNNVIYQSQGVLFRHDTNGVPQPELAESITPSADGLSNTLKLKAGLKYSDGTPVKAADVKAGVEHQKDKGVGAPFLGGHQGGRGRRRH